MPFVNSLDKIILTYFTSVTTEAFEYKGVVHNPKTLRVSPLITRGFTCPTMCGGCCPRFSLDYLPCEARPANAIIRTIQFNGHSVDVYSDLQNDHNDHFCRNLDKSNGRCGIYLVRPFSCDFELIRFFVSEDKVRLSQQLFGRGWQFLTVTGNRGALCDMTPADAATTNETIRKLNRLEQWATHFGILTKVPEIINWIYTDPSNPLTIE